MKINKAILLVFTLLICTMGLNARNWDASKARKYNYLDATKCLAQPARADSTTGFDVQKYQITLSVSQDPSYIEGNVLATVLATVALTNISYELEGLAVSQVKVNGNPVNYTYANGLIDIPLTVNANETFSTQVFYSGTPQLSGTPYNVGMYIRPSSIFTISDPDAGRYWWPCYDHPWDKAIVDLIITMRSDWKVAANGLRESIVDNGDGTSTTTWRGYHPMTTYLVCITAGPYVEIPQTALAGELPILNFVTQAQYNNALTDLSRLPDMIDYYSQLFGEYPFEKYGNATVNMSTFGAMEHQTMTTLGNYIITGNQSQELVIAHELAHQWFGNAVSFLDFKDVWLSEGFATYSEHLWVDYLEGWNTAVDYVQSSYHDYYKNWETNRVPPAIYDPVFGDYFSPPSYEKAASVLHMLRLKMGNDAFFVLLQEWVESFKHGNAVTSEFQALAESISGQDLNDFFQQWIFGRGIPSVELAVHYKAESGELKVEAKTSSPTETPFTIELPLKLISSAATDSLLITASPNGYSNHFSNVQSFDDISFNHNHWALIKELQEIRPELLYAFGLPESVKLSWQSYPGALGYYLYYRTADSEIWICANPDHYIQAQEYLLDGFENGISYEIKLQAALPNGFCSRDSNILTARPIALPMELPLLVVDETRDGNGNLLNPTDEMVDAFYAAAISPLPFEEWDVATAGLPGLEDLGMYKTVFWHADDNNQNLAFEVEDDLANYLACGGKLIFSGWKSAGTFSTSFWNLLLGDNYQIFYDQSASLSGLEHSQSPALILDSEKLLPQWNGMLPMIHTFDGDMPTLYYAQMPEKSNGYGKKAAISIGEASWFLSFPLYYMQPDGARELLQELLSAAGVSTNDSMAPAAPRLVLNAYPNPFNPDLNISFQLPNAGKARIKLYNLKGQSLKTLADRSFSSGSHQLSFQLGEQASGLYILTLEADGKKVSKMITLMK